MNRKDSLAAGYVDYPIGKVGRCPACLKNTYYQTVATERCNDCGYFFDYWDCKGSPQYYAYQAQRSNCEDSED